MRRQAKTMRIADKGVLAEFFSKDSVRHVYGLIDLGDDFFSNCEFYGATDGVSVVPREVFFVFWRLQTPSFVACSPEIDEFGMALAEQVLQRLPANFYALVHPDLVPIIRQTRRIAMANAELRMYLASRDLIPTIFSEFAIKRLTEGDLPAIRELIRLASHETWFEPFMLKDRQTWGIEHDGQLIAMTGTHAHSLDYGAAAIGNVMTRPEFRGKGLGTALVAHQCRHMDDRISTIALNVRQDNAAAIRCYEKVGFQLHSTLTEILVQN